MKKNKIKGTTTRPRLYIFKSNKHLYAQLIDDTTNKILASSSTIAKEINSSTKIYANCENAKIIGKQIAIKSKKQGINQIIFDRGNNLYHGQIKALADAAREEGINF
uniref:Large ribosomal subunit protein uL18c n=1 Tax=Antithamnionella ternifolia TaxID=207919 RepID=A0A4D6WKN3_9FLOR|nr:ribosomal protein L18 [Antithamnionella ternifolia]